jgi:hypothetical protein
MTQEQKRIKIAEAVGKDADYFNDLNAMHEAEKVAGFMSDNFKGRKLKRTWCRHMGGNLNIWFATATQRAEAFGKTLNLW